MNRSTTLDNPPAIDRLEFTRRHPAAPEVAPTPAQPSPAAPTSGGPGKSLLRAATGLLAVVLAGAIYFHYANRFETTDDAYLDGDLHPVSARINGTVSEVLTDDNRPAHRGETLLKLDPRDFQLQLDEARSDLLSAEAAVPQAEAQISQARAQLAQADAGIAQYRTQLDKAAIDLRRANVLMKKSVNAQSELDTFKATYDIAVANSASAAATRDAAVASLRSANASYQVTVAKRGTAQARVRDAELQLSYTAVTAPVDGRVGKKSVEVGQRVQPGQSLLAVVGTDQWIVANFKESQLTRMQPGQAVEIDIDAIAGHKFQGTVESFSPGTGAKFSLLPPDNATGNFTKIVQRLPVKIRFAADSLRGYENRLSPGLSATVKVRVEP